MFVHCKISKVFLINGQLHAFKCNKLIPLNQTIGLAFVVENFFKLAQNIPIINLCLSLCCWNFEKIDPNHRRSTISLGKNEQFFP